MHGCQFYWCRKQKYPGKTTDLLQVADKFITICCIEYISPWAGLSLTILEVIGIDCTGSCRANYMIAPYISNIKKTILLRAAWSYYLFYASLRSTYFQWNIWRQFFYLKKIIANLALPPMLLAATSCNLTSPRVNMALQYLVFKMFWS